MAEPTRAQIQTFINNKLDPQIATLVAISNPSVADLVNLAALVQLRVNLMGLGTV